MNALQRHQFTHPKPEETVLGDSAVACGCDTKLHRPVMFESLAGRGVLYACMNCHAVTCAELRGDDGRFTGNSSTVYFLVPVPEDSMDWLSLWPRISVLQSSSPWFTHQSWRRRDVVYLPAKLRCKTPEKLADQEKSLFEEQSRMTLRERFTECGFPKSAPPAGLPQSFAAFASTWQDLQLTSQSDPQQLLERAQADSLIAAGLLAQREDASNIVIEAVREAKLDAALHMLRASPWKSPELEAALIETMQAVPMMPLKDVPNRIAQWHRIEVPLLIVYEQRLNSPAMSTALRALMRKVARHDATLVDCIRITLREIERPPAS